LYGIDDDVTSRSRVTRGPCGDEARVARVEPCVAVRERALPARVRACVVRRGAKLAAIACTAARDGRA
jgi:hypothetical protein